MQAFILKLAMGIAGEIAARLADPEIIVDLIVGIAGKFAEKTKTPIDDMIVDALKKKD